MGRLSDETRAALTPMVDALGIWPSSFLARALLQLDAEPSVPAQELNPPPRYDEVYHDAMKLVDAQPAEPERVIEEADGAAYHVEPAPAQDKACEHEYHAISPAILGHFGQEQRPGAEIVTACKHCDELLVLRWVEVRP